MNLQTRPNYTNFFSLAEPAIPKECIAGYTFYSNESNELTKIHAKRSSPKFQYYPIRYYFHLFVPNLGTFEFVTSQPLQLQKCKNIRL